MNNACPACGERVSATANYCRMCGHRLVATPQSVGAGAADLGESGSHADRGDDEEVTLSYVTDVPPPVSSAAAAATACEVCGKAADAEGALCGACARLLASSERQDS